MYEKYFTSLYNAIDRVMEAYKNRDILIDTTKQGINKYVVPDLIFDCKKEGVTTDFKLYKFLSKWVENALADHPTEKGGEQE